MADEFPPLDRLWNLPLEQELFQACQTSPLQPPEEIIARRRCHLLAMKLIDEQGNLQKKALYKYQREFCDYAHTYLPILEEYGKHMLCILQQVESFWGKLAPIHPPLCNETCNTLIKATAFLPFSRTLTSADIKRAIMAALLHPLRQSVGSCFGTAPAILTQIETPAAFVDDIVKLLTQGRLERIIQGESVQTPFCTKPGFSRAKKIVAQVEHIGLAPGFLHALQSVEFPLRSQNMTREVLSLCESAWEGPSSVSSLFHKLLKSYNRKNALEHEEASQFLSHDIPNLRSTALDEETAPPLVEQALLAFTSFAENPLLKCWEFSLTSLCDVKTEFSRWNLHHSLGLDPSEPDGIGALLTEALQKHLDEEVAKLEAVEEERNIAIQQIRYVESQLQRASSEDEARRLSAEHQIRSHHIHNCEEQLQTYSHNSSQWAKFLQFLHAEYLELFPRFFQESYDPDIQRFADPDHADEPAGFRLFYKEGGREHAKSWNAIHTPTAWINALCNFFLVTQNEIQSHCEWEPGHLAIREITNLLVEFLKKPAFLRSAFQRLYKSKELPPPSLEGPHFWKKLKETPWAYTSGGTTTTLLETYFRKTPPLIIHRKKLKSTIDLCLFFTETLKKLPPNFMKPFEKNPYARMIATSPNHVFTFFPSNFFAYPGWDQGKFTYTWIRDSLFTPSYGFFKKQVLSPKEQEYLLKKFQLKHPSSPLKQNAAQSLSLQEFAHRLPSVPALVDSFLFEHIPLLHERTQAEILTKASLPLEHVKPFYTRAEFLHLIHHLLQQNTPRRLWHQLYNKAHNIIQSTNALPPKPFIFGDSNWPYWYFAFQTNPRNLQLELWICDPLGIQGAPMFQWDHLWSEDQNDPWEIYIERWNTPGHDESLFWKFSYA